MNKTLRKILVIIICYLCAFAVFAGIVLFFYHKIRYDPENGAATDFLHANQKLQEEIGEIRYVGKRALEEEYENEKGLNIIYGVETYEAEYKIQVHFQNISGEWIPYDYTILELLEEY